MDQPHHLCLHRLCRHLHHLVLLERGHLYQLVLEHQEHHGLEGLEHLVRLFQVELVRQEDLLVHHDLVVQQEVRRVVLCRVDQQERLYQGGQQVDRVQGDQLEHHDQLEQHLLMQVDLWEDLLPVDLLERL